VKLTAVTKAYRAGSEEPVVALDAVDLEVHPGELVAVVGPSGSGKSTLLFTAGGLLTPDAGQVSLDGRDLYALTQAQRARLRVSEIGFVFQTFNLVPYLTCLENIAFPALLAGRSRREGDARARRLLERLGLSARAGRRPHQLSVGERAGGLGLMHAAAWLALREIAARPRRLLLPCAVVAVAVAIVAGVEVASLAREAAVAREIDAMGPSIYVASAGTSVDQVKRLTTAGALPPTALGRVRIAGAASIRLARARAFSPAAVSGVPTVAIRDGVSERAAEPAPRWQVGAELAARAHVAAGSYVLLNGTLARVGLVRPRTGDAEDLALAAAAPERSVAEAASVIEVYLQPGRSAAEVAPAMRAALPEADVLEVARGELADGGIDAELRRHRRLLALVLGVAVAATLAIATHLDATDRRVELATLSAIGVTRLGLTLQVSLRALACAAVGSAGGLLVALVGSAGSVSDLAMLVAFAQAGVAIAAGALLACLGASVPAALWAAVRSPVAALQEAE
jgi:ABC-type taurine transport system ATPase subunit